MGAPGCPKTARGNTWDARAVQVSSAKSAKVDATVGQLVKQVAALTEQVAALQREVHALKSANRKRNKVG